MGGNEGGDREGISPRKSLDCTGGDVDEDLCAAGAEGTDGVG